MNQIQHPAESQSVSQTDYPVSSKNLLREIDLVLIYYILKNMSDEDHPLSINAITDRLNQLFSDNLGYEKEIFNVRTIRRKINMLLDASGSASYALDIAALLEIMIGGRIEVTDSIGILSGKNKKSNGKQKRFFFSPVLTDSDFDLISGSIRCNRYLSEDEKRYLLSRLSILSSENRIKTNGLLPEMTINSLPPRPIAKKNIYLPKDASLLLKNIMTIHYAIENKKQVSIQYGTYDISDNMKIRFCAKGDPFAINPYAMFWNNGQYYLIATNIAKTHPYHFRVDRIINSKINTIYDKNELKIEVDREAIPDSLRPFFTIDSKSNVIFDSARYTATYPNMRIFDKNRLINCTFECTSWSLQILIDTFGPENIHLSPSSIKHSDDELDLYGRPQTFLAATVLNVQYENAQKFCLSNPEYLTLISPVELVQDVADRLAQYAMRYRSYVSQTQSSE